MLSAAERDEAAEIVNGMLAKAKALPQLQRHDHWDWHVHAVDPVLVRVTLPVLVATNV